MNDFTESAGAVYAALESRAEVEGLEELHAERRSILPAYAKLGAMFKGGQSASVDTKRKAHRSLIMQEIADRMRQEFEAKNTAGKEYKEPSEAMLERMARASKSHNDYCTQLERDFIEYTLLDFKIQEINDRIRNRETCLNIYNAELRMAR